MLIVYKNSICRIGEHILIRSSIFSLMSFLTEIFSPEFVPVKLGNYLLANLHQYIEYMRTPCCTKDPFKRGGFLEILAASIIYGRPVRVHLMDIRPEMTPFCSHMKVATTITQLPMQTTVISKADQVLRNWWPFRRLCWRKFLSLKRKFLKWLLMQNSL